MEMSIFETQCLYYIIISQSIYILLFLEALYKRHNFPPKTIGYQFGVVARLQHQILP